MIKIGIIGAVSSDWMGGFNYFRNLIISLDTLKNKELEIFVFVGIKTDIKIKNMFKEYATVIEDSIFDRKSLRWFLMKIEQKLFKTNYFLEYTLKEYNIDILSHSFLTNFKKIKTINWIPDFQHIHLSHMFAKEEIMQRNLTFLKVIKESDCLVVSSHDALKDLKSFAPGYENKTKVLQFVSHIDRGYQSLNENNKIILQEKYGLNNNFFYIPNQFWKHKNHMIVFEAINQLKKEYIDICLVCSGYLEDYRNKNYIHEIKSFIKANSLNDNIKLLGLIDYKDVFGLIEMSTAVINPSLFEGWSSTVEECKSLGKNMILSNLSVHKEQYPEATFFDRNSTESLKDVIRNYKHNRVDSYVKLSEERTKKFADKYVEISNEVIQSASRQ